MHWLRNFVLGHLILGPVGVYILAADMQHPERWDVWYRNPYIAIPYCIAMESLIVGCLIYRWRQERKAEGIRRLQVAVRLQAEGKHEAAEAAYQEGLRLLGNWVSNGRAR